MDVELFLQDTAREAWRAFKGDPLLYVGAAWLGLLLGVVSAGILAGPMLVGFISLTQRRLHGQSARIGDIFEGFESLVSSGFAFLLVVLGIVLGCVVVVGGIAVAAACWFVFHEISYRKVTAIEAIKGSVELLKQHFLHVLLLLIGVALLNGLAHLSIVAIVVTLPFSLVLSTVAYERLSEQRTGSAIDAVTGH